MIGWSGSTTLVSNCAGPVLLELGADQRDVRRRVEEAERGTVEGHEAAPVRHEVEQRLSCSGDLRRVGVDDQGVVVAQRRRVQVRRLLGVRQLDPASGEDRGDLLEAVGRADGSLCRPGRGQSAASPSSWADQPQMWRDRKARVARWPAGQAHLEPDRSDFSRSERVGWPSKTLGPAHQFADSRVANPSTLLKHKGVCCHD